MNKPLANSNQTLAETLKNSAAWYERGELLANIGEYSEALNSFNKAVDLQPDWSAAWVFRAVVLIHLQRYQEALTSCDNALSIHPNDAEAWTFRGVALQRLNRYPEAYASYNRALGTEPSSLWQGIAQWWKQLRRSIPSWHYLNSDSAQ